MTEDKNVLKRVLYTDSTRNPQDVIARSKQMLEEPSLAPASMRAKVDVEALEIEVLQLLKKKLEEM